MADVICDRHTGAPLTLADLRSAGTPPGIRPPLNGMYLGVRHPIELRTANLRGVDLRGVNVTGKDLSDADLTGARLEGLKYDVWTRWPEGVDPVRLGAVEVPPDLGGQPCDGRNFAGMRLPGANFAGGSCLGARFDGADLSGAILTGVALTDARFDSANLAGANLRASRAKNASFRDANLTGVTLHGVDFTGADLTGADLSNALWDARTKWPEGFVPPQNALAEPARPATRDALAARFKALGDPARLTILGLLLAEEMTGEELADTLSLSEPTVSHHLARLRDAGMIVARSEGTRRLHRAEVQRVDEAVSNLAARLVALARGNVDPDAYAQKVLRAFFVGEKLTAIPARQKKQRVILERLAAEFTPGVRYPERDINAILQRFHEDCATLRRLLIAERLLARENGIYWRL